MTSVAEITPKKHIVRGESLVEMMTESPRPRQKPPQNTVARHPHDGEKKSLQMGLKQSKPELIYEEDSSEPIPDLYA